MTTVGVWWSCSRRTGSRVWQIGKSCVNPRLSSRVRRRCVFQRSEKRTEVCKVSVFSMDTFYNCVQDWRTNWTCEQIPRDEISFIRGDISRIMIVPHTVPQFLHSPYLTWKLSPRVSILPTSQETSQTKHPKPSLQRPESPSVRQVPSVAYTGVHMPPKNPFQ